MAALPFLELQAVQLASTFNNYTGEIDMAQSAIFLARASALKVGGCSVQDFFGRYFRS
jgi:hypothetical protein